MYRGISLKRKTHPGPPVREEHSGAVVLSPILYESGKAERNVLRTFNAPLVLFKAAKLRSMRRGRGAKSCGWFKGFEAR